MVTFVVEGWSDHDKIKQAYPQDYVGTVVLNGTKFNNSVRSQIEAAMEKGSVYMLSDPDESGDQIAKVICTYYGIKRIDVDPKRARFLRMERGWKYGVEYCGLVYLRELLGGYVDDSNIGSTWGGQEQSI